MPTHALDRDHPHAVESPPWRGPRPTRNGVSAPGQIALPLDGLTESQPSPESTTAETAPPRLLTSRLQPNVLQLPTGWRGYVLLAAEPEPGQSQPPTPSLTIEQWHQWLRHPLQWVKPSGPSQMIKHSRSGTVCRAVLPIAEGQVANDSAGPVLPREPFEDGLHVVFKRALPRTWLKRLQRSLRCSRSMLTWQRGHALLAGRVPTARPLAVLERRRLGVLLDSVIVTEYIAHAHDLETWLTVQLRQMPTADQPRLKRRVTLALAALLRRLHRLRFTHRDFKAPNVMVQWNRDRMSEPRVLLVDLDGLQRGRWPSRRRQIRAMVRLNVSVDPFKRVTLTDRLRFLKQYLALEDGRISDQPNPAPTAARRRETGWKKIWREISAKSEVKRRVRARHQQRMLAQYGRF